MDQFQPLWIWHRSRGYLWFLWYVASEGYDWMLWIFLFQTVACVSLMSIFSQKSWFFAYWGFSYVSFLYWWYLWSFRFLCFPFLSFFSLFFLLICLWWTARLPALRSQRRKEHVRLVVEIVKFRERDDISNKTSFAYSYNDSFMPSTWRTNRLWTLCCNRNIDAKMMLCVLCFCSKRIIFLKCTVDRPFNINCFSVSCFHNSLQQPFRCVIAPHDNENHEQHCNVFERSKGFWHSFVCLFSACGLR